MRFGWRTALATAAVVAAAVGPPAMSAGSTPAAVSEPGVCQSGSIGRFTDCKSGFYHWDIRQSNGGNILGTVDLTFTISEVVLSNSRKWTAHYAVFVDRLTGVAEDGTTMAVVPQCGGSCSAGSGLPDNGGVIHQNDSIAGDVGFGSPSAGRDISTQTIDLYLFNAAAQTPGTTEGDTETTLGPVRCDDGVPPEDSTAPPVPGCVLVYRVPTFVITSPEYNGPPVPAHAAFVAAAQNDPRTMGLGRPGLGRPLVRQFIADDRVKQRKRRQVCPTSWPRNPSPPGTSSDDRDSCDEYPYSASREGVPQFAVTGHVPQLQNTNAGNRLSIFFQRYHVADGDEFYVQP